MTIGRRRRRRTQVDGETGQIDALVVEELLVRHTRLSDEQKSRAVETAARCAADRRAGVSAVGWAAVRAGACLNRALLLANGMQVRAVLHLFLFFL